MQRAKKRSRCRGKSVFVLLAHDPLVKTWSVERALDNVFDHPFLMTTHGDVLYLFDSAAGASQAPVALFEDPRIHAKP